MKRIILMLECDMGDYSDIEEEDGNKIFYQSDINLQDLNIVGVKIKEE